MMDQFYSEIFYNYDHLFLSPHWPEKNILYMSLGQTRRARELEHYRCLKERQVMDEMNRMRQHEAYDSLAARRQRLGRQHMTRQEESRMKFGKTEEPNYTIVKGTNERLYRVPLHTNNCSEYLDLRTDSFTNVLKVVTPRRSSLSEGRCMEDINTSREEMQQEKISKGFERSMGPKQVAINISHDDNHVTLMKSATLKGCVPVETSMEKTKAKISKDGKEIKVKKAPQPPVTVMVEDASDSENEDWKCKTIWCNRRPSPGQWIEPIKS